MVKRRGSLPYVLGLTGSIGMGKTTTAGFFKDAGIPVWDADAVVHWLYDNDAEAVSAIGSICPGAVINGQVDRGLLRRAIALTPRLLKQVERYIHPLVAKDCKAFIDQATAAGADLIICDIPLLFETEAETWLDGVLVVSTSKREQRDRVLSRPGMSEEILAGISANQMPDHMKRDRADFIIETSNMDAARNAVFTLIAQIRGVKQDGA